MKDNIIKLAAVSGKFISVNRIAFAWTQKIWKTRKKFMDASFESKIKFIMQDFFFDARIFQRDKLLRQTCQIELLWTFLISAFIPKTFFHNKKNWPMTCIQRHSTICRTYIILEIIYVKLYLLWKIFIRNFYNIEEETFTTQKEQHMPIRNVV